MSRTLSAALAGSHSRYGTIAPAWAVGAASQEIALAWAYDTGTGAFWHSDTGRSYSNLVFFDPKRDYAAVVLQRNSPAFPSIAGPLGQRIGHWLEGEPEPDLVPAGRTILRLPRFGNPVQTAIIQFSIRTFPAAGSIA
jgi:hypothetical protein